MGLIANRSFTSQHIFPIPLYHSTEYNSMGGNIIPEIAGPRDLFYILDKYDWDEFFIYGNPKKSEKCPWKCINLLIPIFQLANASAS